MASAKLARKLVEVFPCFVLTFVQNEFETRTIARRFRQFARERPRPFRDACPVGILSIVVCAVVNIFPNSPISHDTSALQLREMTRDTRLAHTQNLLQLRH